MGWSSSSRSRSRKKRIRDKKKKTKHFICCGCKSVGAASDVDCGPARKDGTSTASSSLSCSQLQHSSTFTARARVPNPARDERDFCSRIQPTERVRPPSAGHLSTPDGAKRDREPAQMGQQLSSRSSSFASLFSTCRNLFLVATFSQRRRTTT